MQWSTRESLADLDLLVVSVFQPGHLKYSNDQNHLAARGGTSAF